MYYLVFIRTKFMTKKLTFSPDENGYLKVETFRSGFFKFQIGLDFEKLKGPLQRVEEAYARFSSMPIVGEVANQLEKMTLVSSVYSTNTIEGADLSETETQEAIDLSPQDAQKESEKRVVNLREAYKLAEYFPKYLFENKLDDEQKQKAKVQGWLKLTIAEKIIVDLHEAITKGLAHEDNVPGQYRNNPKSRKTQVGDKNHGGTYTPPKCLDDIKLLVDAFIAWANSPPVLGLPPLYRAPLLHYYFELIHPFWDGNGRTGRVLEAVTLQTAGYRYAPYAISRYYLDNIDYYFSLFNVCRKRANAGGEFSNTQFVEFHLSGLLNTINRLHDRANDIISVILFSSQVNILYSQKKINARQYTIVNNISYNPEFCDYEKLKIAPWYTSLYINLTERTRKRDFDKLEKLGLVRIVKGKRIEISYATPGIQLAEYPITAK